MEHEARINKRRNNGGDRDGHGRFAKGSTGGPGRPRGAKNRTTAELKEDILVAYRERGGIDWLRLLSDIVFVRLLERIMPREIAADIRATVEARRGKEQRLEQVSLLERLIAMGDPLRLIEQMEQAQGSGDLGAVQARLPLLDNELVEARKRLAKAQEVIERGERVKAYQLAKRDLPKALPESEAGQVETD